MFGRASWSLDSERSGFEELESGVNATARDYARFGLVFLRRGRSKVRDATTAQTATDHDNFYAFGNLGQYIYVAPAANAVIVRTGDDWGPGNRAWLDVLRDVADGVRP